MAAIKEIGYFNSIFVKSHDYATTNTPATRRYHIEESRIKGGFNETQMDLGVRAFLVNDEYSVINRKNAMIYSGIYNAKTAVNELNQFSIGDNITKAVDITDGSIQKLYAEERELIILQEDKVNAAGINKDFIFTAEGQPLSTASNVVIGQVRTYLGKYGISENPESFAVKGNRKYFTDKKRGVVLRLTRDGLTEISNYGMRDYFKDNLQNNTNLIGGYDNVKDQYILTLWGGTYTTIGYDESSRGWTSFYTYYHQGAFTLNGIFYTLHQGQVYEHYKNSNYNIFYGQDPVSSQIQLVVNTDASVNKNFKTLGYEGTSGWEAMNISTDLDNNVTSDTGVDIKSYQYNFGWKKDNTDPNNPIYLEIQDILPNMFTKKENKYFATIENAATTAGEDEVLFGHEFISGIKGMYMNVTFKADYELSNPAGKNIKQELFAVSSEVAQSSQ